MRVILLYFPFIVWSLLTLIPWDYTILFCSKSGEREQTIFSMSANAYLPLEREKAKQMCQISGALSIFLIHWTNFFLGLFLQTTDITGFLLQFSHFYSKKWCQRPYLEFSCQCPNHKLMLTVSTSVWPLLPQPFDWASFPIIFESCYIRFSVSVFYFLYLGWLLYFLNTKNIIHRT